MSTQFGERYRRSAYLEEQKPYMLPLPVSAFEPAVWSVAKVANDYLLRMAGTSILFPIT